MSAKPSNESETDEFLRLQYEHLRRMIDENISQRRRMQEYVLAFVAAIYVWIILNGEQLANLPANALFWIRWLPALVVLGAAARWLGHQFVIKVAAEHMRAIEVYFRTTQPDALIDLISKQSIDNQRKIQKAILGYESAIHSSYSDDRLKGFLNRFPASVSEFAIGALTLTLTVVVSLAFGEVKTQDSAGEILKLEFGGFELNLERD